MEIAQDTAPRASKDSTMTVTLVSSPPASAQTATVDANSAKDAPADGGIFAALLLGQLIPTTPESLPETTTTDSSRAADDGLVDPAAVLAALTLPTEPGRDAGVSGDRTVSSDSTLSALSAAGRSRSDTLPAESSIPVMARDTASAENAAQTIETGNDKPAKIAATAAFSLPDATLSTTKDRVTDDKASPQPAPLAVQALNQNAPAAENRDASLAVKTPFRDQGWDADFGQKIMWLAKNDKHSAQLTLNPAQMGPIEISITVDKGNATASFASANADVREAIETALPRLREMFANAGIQLGQTNVGAESFQRQAANDGAGFGGARWVADNAILASDPVGSGSGRTLAVQQGNGMVDIFA
jgi:flagellar hook-length control protein FliK